MALVTVTVCTKPIGVYFNANTSSVKIIQISYKTTYYWAFIREQVFSLVVKKSMFYARVAGLGSRIQLLLPTSYQCRSWEEAGVAQVIGLLFTIWEIWIVFLAPAMTQPWPLWAFGEWTCWWELCLSVSQTRNQKTVLLLQYYKKCHVQQFP